MGGVVRCFLFLGRPLPRLVRLLLSSSCCCCRSLICAEKVRNVRVPLRWRRLSVCHYSSGVINYSKHVQPCPMTLTACLAVSAVCSNLSASPCTSSAAPPDEHGIPLPRRPTRPQTFYCTAEGRRDKCNYFFHLWVIITFDSILPAPPSAASSCTSCQGPAFWADQCETVFRWPPTESVCLLQEDSPDPLMSHLVRKQRILKHERKKF